MPKTDKVEIIRDQVQVSKLIFHIENKRPIELDDLSSSMRAMANLYNRFNKNNPVSNESKDAKLYVTKITEGSIVIELQDMLYLAAIPFIENSNSIIEFTKHIKTLANRFLTPATTDNDEADEQITIADCQDIGVMMQPVAKDTSSQTNFSAVVNGDVKVYLNLDSKQSNTILEETKSFISKAKETTTNDDLLVRELLIMYQARNTQSSKVGNKGVIDSISDKPMNITFASDDLQKEMLSADVNPLTASFEVDVKIQTANGAIKAYQIQKIHQIFEED